MDKDHKSLSDLVFQLTNHLVWQVIADVSEEHTVTVIGRSTQKVSTLKTCEYNSALQARYVGGGGGVVSEANIVAKKLWKLQKMKDGLTDSYHKKVQRTVEHSQI